MRQNSNKVDHTEVSATTETFEIFKVMYDNGDVAKMGSHAFNIYAYIKATVQHNDAETYPTVEEVSEKTGISRATVLRELPKLIEMAYVSQRKQGRKSVYTVNERIPLVDQSGQVRGTATWEYIPNLSAKAVDEVRAILDGHMTPDGAHFVHIENVQIVVSHLEAGATQTNMQTGTVMEQVVNDGTVLEYRERVKQSEDPKARQEYALAIQKSLEKAVASASDDAEKAILLEQLEYLDSLIKGQ